MAVLDLLDRLLEHDRWTTRRVLDLAATLTEAQLDQEFDLGHRTLRHTLRHLVGNIEIWTDLMMGRPIQPDPDAPPTLSELRRRWAHALDEFARLARSLRDAGRLNETYLDVLDQPPQPKSFGGTLLHVLTHDHLHRAEVLHMLDRLGVPGLIEGDVLSWEAASRK